MDTLGIISLTPFNISFIKQVRNTEFYTLSIHSIIINWNIPAIPPWLKHLLVTYTVGENILQHCVKTVSLILICVRNMYCMKFALLSSISRWLIWFSYTVPNITLLYEYQILRMVKTIIFSKMSTQLLHITQYKNL